MFAAPPFWGRRPGPIRYAPWRESEVQAWYGAIFFCAVISAGMLSKGRVVNRVRAWKFYGMQ